MIGFCFVQCGLALFEFILLFFIFLNITGKDLKPSLLRKHARTCTSDPLRKSKFNRVNLECLLFTHVRAIQYKLGSGWLTRLGNSNVLRLPTRIPSPGYCLKNFVNLFFLYSEKFDVKTIILFLLWLDNYILFTL